MNKRIIIFIIFSLNLLNTAIGQQELGTHFMNVWQSNISNPSLMNKNRITIGLPSVYANLHNTGFSFNDIFEEIPGTDSLRLNMDDAISNLKSDNFLNFQTQVDWFSVGFRTSKFQIGGSFSWKSSFYVNYPKEMLDIFWNGNAKYIGETINIAPDFQAYSYAELGINGAFNITDNITVGARLKYLSGIVDISNDLSKQEATIYTDPQYYQVTLGTNYAFNSSSYPIIDSTITNVNGNTQFDYFKLFGNNTGIAGDLGLTMRFADNIQLSAGVADLGFINWSSNLRNYKTEGSFTYNGIEFNPLVDNDSLSFDAIGDTIVDIFDVQVNQSNITYKTNLPTKIHISGQYELPMKLTLGLLLYGELYREQFLPAVALSARKEFGDIFSVGGIYAYRNRSPLNLGLNAAVKMGPVQLYLATDNIVPLFSPYNSKNFNGRIGMNILLGKVKKDENGILPTLPPQE